MRVKNRHKQNQPEVDDLGEKAMLKIGFLGLVLGAVHAKYMNVFWIASASFVATIWVGFVHSAMGHTVLHAAREGFYSAWSLEIGLLSGALFDCFIRSKEH
jgi:hypothetical protein